MKKKILSLSSCAVLAAALFGAVLSAQAADLPSTRKHHRRSKPESLDDPPSCARRPADTGGSTVNVGNPLIPALSSPNSACR